MKYDCSRLLWICFVYKWEWTLGLWLGNRGQTEVEKGVEYSVTHWWQELEQGQKNATIFGFSTVSYCLKHQAQGLPEKNVALMIRKEQLIMSNDDLMAMFVLTGQLTFLYWGWVLCLVSWSDMKNMLPADGAIDSKLSKWWNDWKKFCKVQVKWLSFILNGWNGLLQVLSIHWLLWQQRKINSKSLLEFCFWVHHLWKNIYRKFCIQMNPG